MHIVLASGTPTNVLGQFVSSLPVPRVKAAEQEAETWVRYWEITAVVPAGEKKRRHAKYARVMKYTYEVHM